MSGLRFVTREIGSLAKPSWRVKAFADRPLEESDFVAAEEWGRRLEVKGHEALVERLRGGSLNLPEIDDWAAIYAIRLLERGYLCQPASQEWNVLKLTPLRRTGFRA